MENSGVQMNQFKRNTSVNSDRGKCSRKQVMHRMYVLREKTRKEKKCVSV